MKDFSRDLATTAFMQGYDAVDKWLHSNKIKKGIRLWGKELADINHGWSEKLHIKPNRWSEYKNLFRNEDSFKHAAVVSYGNHPSFRVLKWGKIELNLHGMGKFGKTLIQSCKNLGVKVLLIMAHYTSITCCRCNYIDRKSRISRDKFKCTHCKFECDADLNAAINIRWYWLPCIRKMTEFDYYGNYIHNDSSINLANSNVNCVKHGTGGDGAAGNVVLENHRVVLMMNIPRR